MQDQDKYVLRLPDGLRDSIKAAAKANGRSMNAEMLMRLGALEDDATADEAPSPKPFMGRRNDAQFQLRMPSDLRNEVCDAAAVGSRSMTAEILSRIAAGSRSGELHDMFAAHAFGGLIAASAISGSAIDNLAERALECADAMLKAREARS